LAADGIKLNITAIFTTDQIKGTIAALSPETAAIISVFAGRIADTGVDPIPLIKEAKALLAAYPKFELLWASPRELLNIFHAEEAGSDIITVSADLLKKVEKVGYSLDDFSVDTVKMFYDDGQKAGYKL
jgi:transaldolase